jgi:hypothetical protein
LLDIIVEVYIDDIVLKSTDLESLLVNLRLAFVKMRQYGLKMNPLKCVNIEIDPKKVESIKKVKAPTCKKDLQSFLGKVNYLRRFISNLSGKVKAFTPILWLKNDAEFI